MEMQDAVSTYFIVVSANGEVVDYDRAMAGVSWAACLRQGANLCEVWPGGPFPGEGTGGGPVIREIDGAWLQFHVFRWLPPAAGKTDLPLDAPLYILSVVDLTPVVKLRERLNAAEKEADFFRGICENSYDEIYVADGKGMTIYANSACERHYGVKPSEVIGKSVYELETHGVYYPAVTPLVLREKRRVTIDQATRTGKRVMITGTPVFGDDGEIAMVVMNSRDITVLEDMKRNFKEAVDMAEKYRREVEELRRLRVKESQLICASDRMTAVVKLAEKAAATDSTILLLGESGVGKDLLAKLVHQASGRRTGPFLKINCAAIPKDLLESELFGYKAGAFTGAGKQGKIGLFSLADGGTIFLDEVAEIPLPMQPKLLQVLEDREFTPIGATRTEKVDLRIVAATNRNLLQLVEEGHFRRDLFYRLNVVQIAVPPLRERRDDIVPLVEFFLEKFNMKHGTGKRMSLPVLQLLHAYDWPGNVRELEHLVEHLVVVSDNHTIAVENLPEHIKRVPDSEEGTLRDSVEDLERELIRKAYHRFRSSYKVARYLGISQSSANRKIRKYCR